MCIILQCNYLLIPLPNLPQVIDIKLWLHILFPVERYEWNLEQVKMKYIKRIHPKYVADALK